jgi:hypothetical protein
VERKKRRRRWGRRGGGEREREGVAVSWYWWRCKPVVWGAKDYSICGGNLSNQ